MSNKPHSISEVVAPLILKRSISLKTISLLGQIISLDATIQDYDNGPKNEEELGVVLELYELLLHKSIGSAREFLLTGNEKILTQTMIEIRNRLTAVGERLGKDTSAIRSALGCCSST